MNCLIKGDLEVSNILIVESENDKYFIETIIQKLNLNIEIDNPICSINEYECIGGMSNLKTKLEELKASINKDASITKVGIIFDADKIGIAQRKKDIQEKIDLVFENIIGVDFPIYIMNVNGYGELETVLKAIKSQDATVANCLESWQECLPDSKKLNQKEFDKFWIQIYQRYDCCTKKESKRAGEKCNNEASLQKDIYDFNDPILDNLKKFLKEIGEKNDNTTSN
jgi:hypothetical protein